jgi:hypothetical protein
MKHMIFLFFLSVHCSNQSFQVNNETKENYSTITTDTCKINTLNSFFKDFSEVKMPFTMESYYRYTTRMSEPSLQLVFENSDSKNYEYKSGIVIHFNSFHLVSILKTNIEDDFESSELLVTIDTCGKKISEVVIGQASDKALIKCSIANSEVMVTQAMLLYQGVLRSKKVDAILTKKRYLISDTGIISLKDTSIHNNIVLYWSDVYTEFLIPD